MPRAEVLRDVLCEGVVAVRGETAAETFGWNKRRAHHRRSEGDRAVGRCRK